MKTALLALAVAALAGCGGGGQDCVTLASGVYEPVTLAKDGFTAVVLAEYQSDGGEVTISGSFRVEGVNTVKIWHYDSYASTQTYNEVLVVGGVAQIPPYTWTPSTARRTAIVYAGASVAAKVTEQKLLVEQCR